MHYNIFYSFNTQTISIFHALQHLLLIQYTNHYNLPCTTTSSTHSIHKPSQPSMHYNIFYSFNTQTISIFHALQHLLLIQYTNHLNLPCTTTSSTHSIHKPSQPSMHYNIFYSFNSQTISIFHALQHLLLIQYTNHLNLPCTTTSSIKDPPLIYS